MNNVILVVFLSFFVSVSFANPVSDNESLQRIMEDFESAIATKDKSKFLSLFYEGTVSWVGVLSDKDHEINKKLASEKIAKGEMDWMPTKAFQSTPEKFIEGVISRRKAPKETFENIKMVHDGKVATIYFYYEFYDGDIKMNWGKESWSLVNTEKGWKINSIVFSINRT